MLVAGWLLLVVAGCGGGDPAPAPRPPAPAAEERVPWQSGDLDRTRRAQAMAERAARRYAALTRLRGVPTVGAALRRAHLRGAIGAAALRRYRAAHAGARKAAAGLPGARGVEQRAVLANVEALAAGLRLTPSRLPAVFLTLRRNTRTWTQAPLPAAGDRRTFGRSPAVFQYVPGQGMQLHPLATWGRLNAGLHRCVRPGATCARRALRRQVDAAARLASDRGGFPAWEYQYRYAQGTPPWLSGMAQATAVQALARAARALDRRRYARLARAALGAFRTPPPDGVAVPAAGGARYVMYSFAPSMQILNGELQAVNGLRTAATLVDSPLAARLARRGDAAARRTVAGFDTGAWSLYSAGGAEASLSYHQLTTGFLGDLCRWTGRPEYCGAERRFARYEREPPRIGIDGLERLRARRTAPLRVSVNKGAAVSVRVDGPRGLVLARDLQLGRGAHDIGFVPPSRGRFLVQVSARGPEGRVGVADRTVRVTLPKPKPKPEPKPRMIAGERDAPQRPAPSPRRGEATGGGEAVAGVRD